MKIEAISFIPEDAGAPEPPKNVCFGFSFECGLWFAGVGESPREAWSDMCEAAAGNGEIDRSTVQMFKVSA